MGNFFNGFDILSKDNFNYFINFDFFMARQLCINFGMM